MDWLEQIRRLMAGGASDQPRAATLSNLGQSMPADWANRFATLQDWSGNRPRLLGERRQDLPMALQPDTSVDASMLRRPGQAPYFPNMDAGQFYRDLTRNSMPTMDDLMPFLRGTYQPQQAPMVPRTLGDLYR